MSPSELITIITGPHGPLLVLAHGAGAPMDSVPMTRLTLALNQAGIRVMRFEFPYLAKTREDGRRRPPDRAPALMACWQQALARAQQECVKGERFFVGGKSMGGRMASHLLAQPDDVEMLAGGLCFGYPFHPPGKPDRWRTEHFADLRRPLWIAQGERDPFGKRREVTEHGGLNEKAVIHWVPDANHDLVPAKRSGLSTEQVLAETATAARRFMGVSE